MVGTYNLSNARGGMGGLGIDRAITEQLFKACRNLKAGG